MTIDNNGLDILTIKVLITFYRLSYHQRLVDTTPQEFGPLLPNKPEPNFKFQEEGAGTIPGTIHAHNLITAIRSKCSPHEAVAILKELPNPKQVCQPSYDIL